MSICSIKLDKSQYSPNDVITGKVQCNFYTPTVIQDLRIKIKGEEHSHWTEIENGQSIEYYGSNTFFSLEKRLSKTGQVNSGQHEYPFSLVLPLHVPSSYESQNGSVRFYVKLIVRRPEKDDVGDTVDFQVQAPINLNRILNENFGQVVEYVDRASLITKKSFDDGCVTIEVALEKKEFLIGEVAQILVEVTSKTKLNFTQIRAEAGMTVISTTTHPKEQKRALYRLLVTADDSRDELQESTKFTFQLKLPETTVIPNFSNCQLFRNIPAIKVTGVTANRDFVMTIPILIGNIPLKKEPTSPSAPEVDLEDPLLFGDLWITENHCTSSSPPSIIPQGPAIGLTNTASSQYPVRTAGFHQLSSPPSNDTPSCPSYDDPPSYSSIYPPPICDPPRFSTDRPPGNYTTPLKSTPVSSSYSAPPATKTASLSRDAVDIPVPVPIIIPGPTSPLNGNQFSTSNYAPTTDDQCCCCCRGWGDCSGWGDCGDCGDCGACGDCGDCGDSGGGSGGGGGGGGGAGDFGDGDCGDCEGCDCGDCDCGGCDCGDCDCGGCTIL